MKLSLAILSFLLIFICTGNSQIKSLETQFDEILRDKKAEIGVAVYDIDKGDTVTYRNSFHYPMQSVFKFHLALAVLKNVDLRKYSLDTLIYISKRDFKKETWSPLRDKYKKGGIKLPLREILSYTISLSDNNGCDILFKLMSCPAKVNDFIKSLGMENVSIAKNEDEMHRNWNNQFYNWTTPLDAVLLLKKFYSDEILSDTSTKFLDEILTNTTTGPKRIKGLLPQSAIVAHKTGSSGSNDNGITAATNDIGVIKMPSGKKIALAVFVSNSKENEETNERIIAEIAKAVWDYYSK